MAGRDPNRLICGAQKPGFCGSGVASEVIGGTSEIPRALHGDLGSCQPFGRFQTNIIFFLFAYRWSRMTLWDRSCFNRRICPGDLPDPIPAENPGTSTGTGVGSAVSQGWYRGGDGHNLIGIANGFLMERSHLPMVMEILGGRRELVPVFGRSMTISNRMGWDEMLIFT